MSEEGKKAALAIAEQMRLLREALAEAAASLNTISNLAGKDEYLQNLLQVRGYARNRANVALEALAKAGPR